MTQLSDVLDCLTGYADTASYTAEELTPFCERGLLWVKGRLRDGADTEGPLIPPTAAAMAHYFFFLSRLTETDKYESFTAGDMTVRRNLDREMRFEETARDGAIAAAASILKDGGFYCNGSC